MSKNKTRDKYQAMGRCVDCGKEREAEGATHRTCAACSAKRRTRTIQEHQKRKATGLCAACGRPRTGHGAVLTRCGACVRKDRARALIHLQKKRNQAAGYVEGDGRSVKKWPVGTKRDGGKYNLTLTLDRDSLQALLVIRQRYRDAETRAGRDWESRQLSRLVREVIVKYEPNRAVVKPRKHRLLVEQKAHLSLDGRTKAILTRQAALSFNGNKSATLRAMLIECQGFRRAYTGSHLPQSVPVVFEKVAPFPGSHVVDP